MLQRRRALSSMCCSPQLCLQSCVLGNSRHGFQESKKSLVSFFLIVNLAIGSPVQDYLELSSQATSGKTKSRRKKVSLQPQEQVQRAQLDWQKLNG